VRLALIDAPVVASKVEKVVPMSIPITKIEAIPALED